MTVYEVRYIAEYEGDGFGRLYFPSKAAANRASAEITREHRRAVKARIAAEEMPNNFYNWPADPGADPRPEVKKLTFTGSRLKMLLDALRYNA